MLNSSQQQKATRWLSYIVILIVGLLVGSMMKEPLDFIRYPLLFSAGYWLDESLARIRDLIKKLIRGF